MIDVIQGATVAASLAAVAGTAYTMAKNGRSAAKDKAALQKALQDDIKGLNTKVSTINERLDDPDNGLRAIKRSTDAMNMNCAKVHSGLAVTIENMQKEIDEGKQRRAD